MNDQHTQYLFDNFSFFDRTRGSLMGFGFECGDGWFEIVKELCEKISALDPKGLLVVQVKEKFGGLRFYVAGPNDETKEQIIQNLIQEAERKSLKTCEVCGKPGKPNKIGWIQTRCIDCRKM